MSLEEAIKKSVMIPGSRVEMINDKDNDEIKAGVKAEVFAEAPISLTELQ